MCLRDGWVVGPLPLLMRGVSHPNLSRFLWMPPAASVCSLLYYNPRVLLTPREAVNRSRPAAGRDSRTPSVRLPRPFVRAPPTFDTGVKRRHTVYEEFKHFIIIGVKLAPSNPAEFDNKPISTQVSTTSFQSMKHDHADTQHT